jgi:hypothetical protein
MHAHMRARMGYKIYMFLLSNDKLILHFHNFRCLSYDMTTNRIQHAADPPPVVLAPDSKGFI